jgi:hypothetical protein
MVEFGDVMGSCGSSDFLSYTGVYVFRLFFYV